MPEWMEAPIIMLAVGLAAWFLWHRYGRSRHPVGPGCTGCPGQRACTLKRPEHLHVHGGASAMPCDTASEPIDNTTTTDRRGSDT